MAADSLSRSEAEEKERRTEQVLRTLGVNYLSTFDIDQKVKMLQKIRSEERNRDRSKLKFPSINLGSGTARKT